MTPRIIRSPICHITVFERLLKGALSARGTVRSQGRDWRLAWCHEGIRIYEPAEFDLAWLQETVEEYEQELYGMLAGGVAGADGFVRFRTANLTRDGSGAYRERTRALSFAVSGRP